MTNICDRPDADPVLDQNAHAPIVTMGDVTGFGVGTATLNATIDSQLATTSWRFEWGPTAALGNFAPAVDGEVAIKVIATVSTVLTGLQAGVTYFARIHASNAKGVSNSATITFTTSAPAVSVPVCVASAASVITSTGAHLAGTVNPGGGATSWSFHVTSTGAGSVRDPTRDFEDTTLGTGNSQVQYTGASWTQCAGCSVSTPDGSYYYGYTSGDTMTLRFNGVRLVMFAPSDNNGANPASVTVDGVPATAITYFTAGTQTNTQLFDTGVLGASNANHVVVITVPASATPVVTFDHAEIYVASGSVFAADFPTPAGSLTGTGAQAVSVNVDGLAPSTLYSFVLNATNSAGTGSSSTLTFTTSASGGTPVITPQSPTGISGSSAVLHANVNPNGAATTVVADYGTTPSYGTTQSAGSVAVGPAANVQSTLAGLPAATVIHYRFRASNASGTTTEPDQALTTMNGGGPSAFWPFGFALNTNEESATDEAQANIAGGRPMTVCECFPDRGSWGGLANLSGQPDAFINSRRTRLMQIPALPEDGSSNWDFLLNGGADGYWRQMGSRMKAREDNGFPPDIMSIFWEFSYVVSWGYGTASRFITAYRRAVDQMRVTYPNVQTAWVDNGWNSGMDAFYPGDNWVTFAGADWYDFPNFQSSADFNNAANAQGGPLHVLNLIRNQYGPDALGRPKKLIVPEWSVVTGYSTPADKPRFISDMVSVFQNAHSTGHMGPESLWNSFSGSPWDIYYTKPNCRAQYTALYRP